MTEKGGTFYKKKLNSKLDHATCIMHVFPNGSWAASVKSDWWKTSVLGTLTF